MTDEREIGAASDPGDAPVRRSIARDASVLLGSQAVTWTLALLVTAIQPRLLGPEGTGQLRVAFSLWVIADVFIALGTNQLLTIELARDHRRGGLVGRVVSLQLALYGAATIVMAIALAVLRYDDEVVLLVALLGVASLLTIFVNTGRAAFQGLERMSVPAIAEIVGRSATVPVLILALYVTRSPVAAVVVYVLNTALAALITTVALRRVPGISYRLTANGLRRLAKDAVPYFANSWTLVVYQQIDTVIISIVATEAAVGWYAEPDRLMGTLLFVPTVVLTSMFPVITRLHNERNADELNALVRRAISFLVLVSMPIGVGTAIVSGQVARLLWGPGFAESGPVLALFGVSIILLYPTIALATYAVATGRVRFWTVLMIVLIVLTIPLDLLLVPWADQRFDNGAIGGALSYIVTESISLVIAGRLLLPRTFWVQIAPRILRVMVATIGMAAVAWPLRNVLLPVPIAAGAITYAAVVLLLDAAEPSEIEQVRALTSRVTRRFRSRRAT